MPYKINLEAYEQHLDKTDSTNGLLYIIAERLEAATAALERIARYMDSERLVIKVPPLTPEETKHLLAEYHLE